MNAFHVAEHGCELISGLIGAPQRRSLIEAVGYVDAAGKRNMLATAEVAELAASQEVIELVRPHVGDAPRPVRAVWFNKSGQANWLVTWHQDLAIAVRERIDVPGFGGWSVKEGVVHVQPPVAVLERVLAVRVHLDDADADNGTLRLVPGTHALGRLNAEQTLQLRRERGEALCIAAAGDALLMRPLLLHASGRSTCDRPRRVLHIEYAAGELPGGLAWRESD